MFPIVKDHQPIKHPETKRKAHSELIEICLMNASSTSVSNSKVFKRHVHLLFLQEENHRKQSWKCSFFFGHFRGNVVGIIGLKALGNYSASI